MFREFSWTGPGPLVLAFLVWMTFCEVLFRFFLEFGVGLRMLTEAIRASGTSPQELTLTPS